MRRTTMLIGILIAALALPGAAAGQQTIEGRSAPLAWDPPANVVSGESQPTRHELEVNGEIITTGLPAPLPLPQGSYRYTVADLPYGPHKMRVRQCTADNRCGPWSNDLMFSTQEPAPGAPMNFRIEPPPGSGGPVVEFRIDDPALSIPQALEVFGGLTRFAMFREPTPAELQWAIASYRGPIPPTRSSVAAHFAALWMR